MTRAEQLRFLIDYLLRELPQYRGQASRFSAGEPAQRRLLRSLMNVRPPMPLHPDFLAVQDALLGAETLEKGVVDAVSLPGPADARIRLWQGDITRLAADAVVNAANSALLGCFVPCHGCIDNAIHSAAGLQLRDECSRLMQAQGHDEPTGSAKLTGAYNLPSRYVLHTVGPIVQNGVGPQQRKQLASCYRACLELAAGRGLKTVAFCCISTGEFRFPNREAAAVAVETVRKFLPQCVDMQVIFNVYKQIDFDLYRELLGAD